MTVAKFSGTKYLQNISAGTASDIWQMYIYFIFMNFREGRRFNNFAPTHFRGWQIQITLN